MTVLEAQTLWSSSNGRVACQRHSGAYLDSAARQRPKANSHNTPLGRFTRITQADVEAWDAYGDMGPMQCETCKAPAKTA